MATCRVYKASILRVPTKNIDLAESSSGPMVICKFTRLGKVTSYRTHQLCFEVA